MDPVPPGVTRAAVWTGDGIDVRRVDVPPLRDGETVVRIAMATVCGSDLHTVTGRRSAPCPSVLGHEAVGAVVATGAGAPVALGDRVVWGVTVACGRCSRCLSGRTAKCCSVRKVGHEPFNGDWPLSGGYAEHIVLPAGATFAVVPSRLPDAVAAPAACATATVMAALEAAGAIAGRRVLVCGAGMLGVTAVAACVDAGATVSVVDLDDARMGLATSFGGRSATRESVDVAFDFTGAAQAIQDALASLDVGGTLVLAGSVLPGPAVSLDPESIVRQWLTITGVHNYEPRHLIRAIDFLDATLEVFPWADLVAEPVALPDVADAFSPLAPGKLRAAIAPQT
ncbi:MAG: zinc-binding dehydrogenase [Mycobacterium sp.]